MLSVSVYAILALAGNLRERPFLYLALHAVLLWTTCRTSSAFVGLMRATRAMSDGEDRARRATEPKCARSLAARCLPIPGIVWRIDTDAPLPRSLRW